MFMDNGPPNFLFSVAPIIFFVVFFLVFGIIIFGIVKSIGQWKYNNSQPILSVIAKVTAKRPHSTSSIHNGAGETGMHHVHSSTTYFVTFEVESGDRMEFMVNGSEYGQLAEDDIGKLNFQGTRYLSFLRSNAQ
ncbi:DUF2500 domain-containing protein [Desulfosporosinus fructosivorans]|uniref:DUF2500 domain-containing protein n=1 Tax=Desulfosporosinus fructosivorans TaxID=2018669 RepID=A0A4Z0R4S9_9FIRM|nr:DUF2500 domain-containing protein [Desulfosporosinus fructosivorans]TGE37345.1 DUF2500 domain-containing protein [Desulfosporosinus fructosivorans]